MSQVGLVLSGGGARGAYQAGVLSAIAEICRGEGIDNPFQTYTGLSSGAINLSFLAANPLGFIDGCREIRELWSKIETNQVFLSDVLSLSHIGLSWISELSLGGIKPHTPGLALLDTSPLRDYIEKQCDFNQIQKNIEKGFFDALAISAMSYEDTSTITFVESKENIKHWTRARRRSFSTKIGAEHVLASAAIPLLFPPVKVGESYYGDGCIRNQSPCGPAIYMGADRLIAIGVRKRQDLCFAPPKTKHHLQAPSVARMANVLLHAVMMDGMEIDIERIERINLGLQKIPEADRKAIGVRPIDCLWISPSREMSEIALKKADQLPRMIRYLIRGLGKMEEAGELVSFLLFDPSYSLQLLDLGYQDGLNERDKILQILDPNDRLRKDKSPVEKHL